MRWVDNGEKFQYYYCGSCKKELAELQSEKKCESPTEFNMPPGFIIHIPKGVIPTPLPIARDMTDDEFFAQVQSDALDALRYGSINFPKGDKK
jgi:hypothetical protein